LRPGTILTMPRSTYAGPSATIADMRRIGLSAVVIECAALWCYHQVRIEFDALGLPNELSFPDITKHRRFVCTKCGSRKVTTHICWNDFVARGNGKQPLVD
jgi:hypothetical protein